MSSLTSPSGTGSVDQSQLVTVISVTLADHDHPGGAISLVTTIQEIPGFVFGSQPTSTASDQPQPAFIEVTSTIGTSVPSLSPSSNSDSNTIIAPTATFSSISSSNLKDSNSHIGAIIGVAVGGLIALNITIVALVLIYRSKRRSKQRFLEAFDRNGDFQPNRPGRKSTGDETGTGAGGHLVVAEMNAGAQPRGVTLYPFSSSTPVPPVMTALYGGTGPAADTHGVTSVAGLTAPAEGGFGGRSTRNVFIHQDGGRVEMASQDRLGEGEQEEIPPTYESLIRSIRSGGFWSWRSEIGSRVSSGRSASRSENETGRSGPGK
ncbi:hypothetical protein C8J55DRAFT_578786 [Lentinula edodes]|uniref:Mid2 domain-containing protein n=1 Tax=Lentinula lateritia TaxID=40482 RepID=A0A9W9A4W1_9AGAR|nr:hypothetical protein C8J55DRAFT_578786 [Lentinula edodes]